MIYKRVALDPHIYESIAELTDSISNPSVGDCYRVRRSDGYFSNYVWMLCPICNKGRWVGKTNLSKSNFTGNCKSCQETLWGKLKSKRAIDKYDSLQGLRKALPKSFIGDRKAIRYRDRPRPKWYIWVACPECGKERWMAEGWVKRHGSRCHKCASKSGEDAVRWGTGGYGGGRTKSSDGYIMVRLYPDDPLYPMIWKRNHMVYEHRLVMARHLGRLLVPGEVVHHINGIKDDNRIENLKLVTVEKHLPYTDIQREKSPC